MHSRPLVFGIQELVDNNLYSKMTIANVMVDFLHGYQDFFPMQTSVKVVMLNQYKCPLNII
jgi:hypothetical protein